VVIFHSGWKFTIENDNSIEFCHPHPIPHMMSHILPTPNLEPNSLETVLKTLDDLKSSQTRGSAIDRLNQELVETHPEHDRFVGTLYVRHQRYFFAEFIDHSESIELTDINPKYLSLAGILDRISFLPLFEFFC
jgi:hypothetical protein